MEIAGLSSAARVPWERLDSIISAPRHPRDGWDSVISGPRVISAPGTLGIGGIGILQMPRYPGDYRDSTIPGSQVPSGLAGLGHYGSPCTLWTDGDSVTSVPPPLWALARLSHAKPHGHSGSKYRSDSRDSIRSAPQVPWERLDSIVSAPRHPRDGRDSVISDPREISALRLAGSVFSVAQVPCGLARHYNSRLAGTFGNSGTRSL